MVRCDVIRRKCRASTAGRRQEVRKRAHATSAVAPELIDGTSSEQKITNTMIDGGCGRGLILLADLSPSSKLTAFLLYLLRALT